MAPSTAPSTARARIAPDEVHRVVSTALDGGFYRAVNPDLADSGLDSVRHYLLSGWREGRDPAPWFSTRAYVEVYPEVIKAGWNPFCHYLLVGRREGREVVRSVLADDYLLRRARRGEEPAWSFETLAGGAQAADEMAEEAAIRHRERVLAGKEFDAVY
ncbi:MAG TPA: hypothetical protein VHN39_14885, partial [Phenylobacterium sp.]|nr:hypothetical protein [Phenylobacterium sp.]